MGGHVLSPKVRFPGFVFAVCPMGAMFCPQKFDFRVLYSRFAPWGPCVVPKSSISEFCIRGLPHGGHVLPPKVRFPGFVFAVCPMGAMFCPKKFDFRVLYSRFAPWGPCFAPKSSISGFCIRGLPHGGPCFAPQKFDFRD